MRGDRGVLKVRRDDGPDLMTFTEAGALGVVASMRQALRSPQTISKVTGDYRQVGVPLR